MEASADGERLAYVLAAASREFVNRLAAVAPARSPADEKVIRFLEAGGVPAVETWTL